MTKLGVSWEIDTIFRLFAPRAKKVALCIFEDSEQEKLLIKQSATNNNGIWEVILHETFWGKYYGYCIDGKIYPDPYCRANVFHKGLSILIEPNSIATPFKEWKDQSFIVPERKDLIIWECSIRDLTSHKSSGINEEFRGKYLGLIQTENTMQGIGHAKDLGINAVEFLPVFEFDDDPPGSYHWGYMPSFFFAPEASYASNPYGKQYYEFKELVNRLHQNNLAVILDVVFNHTGEPQILMNIDKDYFYRPNSNFSGCGNDFKTESPMARKIIIDSLKYWVTEFHIDGFRFDLAELIDIETLNQIEKELPNTILIAEPWSFRGNIKGKLRTWINWNDDFRDKIKSAALGHIGAKDIEPVLKGSVNFWTNSPLETLNYVESHDNHTLIDYLCQNHKNPLPIDIKRDIFCAAVLLLSPGIPMLAQGQEMLRTKYGNHNSYDAGDQINAVDYELKKRFPQVYSKYKELIAFRKSNTGAILRNVSAQDCKDVKTYYQSNALALHWIKEPFQQLLIFINPDNHQIANFSIPGKFKQIFSTESMTSEFNIAPLSIEVWTNNLTL